MFENVDGRTDGWMDGRRTDGRTTDDGVTGILIAHLRAFGSGELKIMQHRFFPHKIVNVFFTHNFLAYTLGAQKNRLIEKVLLSTNNICFG